ncbi:MAG: hypothetical protein ACETWM_07465 [Candidatus Lokiarchaeia archaeon]
MEELLGEVLSHIGRARSAEGVDGLKLEAWLARASLELFLVKLVLLHGLEEREPPSPPRVKRGDPDKNLKLLDLAEEKVSEARKSFGEGDYFLMYEYVWDAKNALSKIVTSSS